jgi:signal transduction histidine kinase/CheY-like chemotaxis protein
MSESRRRESTNELPSDNIVPLESVLCTDELNKRPPRPPDYETENRALVSLAQELALSRQTILQTLADKILEVLRVGSAGISLLSLDGKTFYWPAIAGMWKPYVGGGTPRDFGPCGDVLDRNAPLMFRHPELRYTYFLPVTPPVEECILVPFYVDGKAVGTIWAIAHDDRRKFDGEDMRQLISLGSFASTAYQAVTMLDAKKQQDETLKQTHTELAQNIVELQEATIQAQDSRRAALNLMEDAVQSREAMVKLNTEIRAKEVLVDSQRQALQMLAEGASLEDILGFLIDVVEHHSPKGMLAAITPLNEAGTYFERGTGPSLPEAFNAAVEGVEVSSPSGLCANAVRRCEALAVQDFNAEEAWQPFGEFVAPYGLRSGWSIPIISSSGQMLGTFSNYYRHVCDPTPQNREFVEMVVRTAAIAIERKRAEKERERLLANEHEARKEAETANRVKDEFLAVVSHELRTPLNAILGWAHMLMRGSLDEKNSARGLETIARNAKAQNQLISDLLDVSRIISGQLRCEMAAVDLIPLINAAVDTVRPAADAKGVQLNLTLEPAAGMVSGDAARLQQIVSNLLTNAVKFTPQNGHIDGYLMRKDTSVVIIVSDTGEGISPEFLPFIFDRFRQAEGTSSRHHGGLGLGLAIVRHLVELHRGTVSAASEGVGKGATFRAAFPCIAVTRIGTDLENAYGVALEDNQFLLLEGVHVLVVDDEPDARELLTIALTQSKADVRAVSTAREALEMLNHWKPDVLISDIGLPGEDGYELIRKVRALEAERGQTVPAVALTGYASDEDAARARIAGFQLHMPKPVSPNDLVTAVATLALKTRLV